MRIDDLRIISLLTELKKYPVNVVVALKLGEVLLNQFHLFHLSYLANPR